MYVSLSLGYAYVFFVCLVSKLTFSEGGKYVTVSFFVFLPAPCPWPDLRTLREGRSDAHLSLSPSLHFFSPQIMECPKLGTSYHSSEYEVLLPRRQ